MEFSLWPWYGRAWSEILSLAHWAEGHGLHGLWAVDHLMPNTNDGNSHTGDQLECWTVLAGIAAAVPRLRLVSMVSPTTIHHPVVLAKRAVSVDHLSGGRAVLGIGAGWQLNEHRAYGFELLAPGARVDRFDEAMQIIHALLRLSPGATTSFDGHHFRLENAPFAPPSVQATLPILVGTGSPRMLRICARWADEWNTWGDLAEVRVRTDRFLAACDHVDRDPATVRRSAQALLFLVRTPAERAAAETLQMAGRSLIGSPQELIEMLGQYAAMGVAEFAICDASLGATAAERQDRLDDLYANVIAHVPR